MISIVTKKELRYFRETVERQTLALREADARAEAAEAELRKLKATPEKLLHCSFCGKDQNSVKKLVAGPTVGTHTSFICNECVAICVDICMGEEKP